VQQIARIQALGQFDLSLAHLRQSGAQAVVLHPTGYTSNLLAVAPAVAHEGTLFGPAGGAKVAVIDPRDVAAVRCSPARSRGR
jgi:uncharacterized protein YbjT (DUF2867 family)